MMAGMLAQRYAIRDMEMYELKEKEDTGMLEVPLVVRVVK